jgi:hypothetical protein
MNDFTGTQEGYVLTSGAHSNLFHASRAATHRVQPALSFQIDVSRNRFAESLRNRQIHSPPRLPRFFAPVSERTMPRSVCTS